MSDVEDMEANLTLDFIEAEENQKKKIMKIRNKDHLTMAFFKFSKRLRLRKSSVFHL